MDQSESPQEMSQFRPGTRVHANGDPRRRGTVRYVGPVEGYSGIWVGVDWDNGEAKHDGSINGVRYFHAKSEKSGSFVRPLNLSYGISLLDALVLRYRVESEKEDEGIRVIKLEFHSSFFYYLCLLIKFSEQGIELTGYPIFTNTMELSMSS